MRKVAAVGAVLLAVGTASAAAAPQPATTSYEVQQVALSFPSQQVAVDPNAHLAWVTNRSSSGGAYLVSTATGKVLSTIGTGRTPVLFAVDPATDTAYLSGGGDPSVSVFPLAGPSTTISVDSSPAGIALDAGLQQLFVGSLDNDLIDVIDTTTRTVTGTIALPGRPAAMAVDSAAHLLYVADPVDNAVWVVDEVQGAVVATIPVGANPQFLALDPTDGKAYVLNHDDVTVSVVDLASRTVIATIPVGSGLPNGIDVDPTVHRVYVSSELDQQLFVIDTTTDAVVDRVPVGIAADAVAVDPLDHAVVVTDFRERALYLVRPRSVPDPQTITFTSTPDAPAVGGAYTATATGGASGNRVTFSSPSASVCSVTDNGDGTAAVRFLQVGSCSIVADQAGGDGFDAAPTQTQAITVAPSADHAPTIRLVGGSCDPSVLQTGTARFAVADADGDPVTVSVVRISDQSVTRPADVLLGGIGATRTLTVHVSRASARSVITLAASDGTATTLLNETVISGANGAPTAIQGTSANDIVLALHGGKSINAGGGDDLVCGSDGADTIAGANGNDVLVGGAGDDTLTGGNGADAFSGGTGTDTVTDYRLAQGDNEDATIP